MSSSFIELCLNTLPARLAPPVETFYKNNGKLKLFSWWNPIFMVEFRVLVIFMLKIKISLFTGLF